MKRGQISVFVILSVLIIAVVVGYFFIKKTDLNFGKEKVNLEVQPVYNFIENCVKETAENAIVYVSESGGYYILPNMSYDLGIAYYLYDGKNYMPSKEKIEEQISLYVEDDLDYCLNGFGDFPDFNVNGGEIESEVRIYDEKVVFKINYPLSISKGENSYVFNEFKNEVDVRLGIIYDAIYILMIDQMERTDSICIACVYDMAEDNDLYIQTLDYNSEKTIFTIRDENSKIKDEDFVFNFVNKYRFLEL